ncbi:unnamed protein product [Amoebophrya sp. A120]|nr:unnamed protein product [Amoebophrya sp. A120]|eukprot:GSA120T00025760001.1
MMYITTPVNILRSSNNTLARFMSSHGNFRPVQAYQYQSSHGAGADLKKISSNVYKSPLRRETGVVYSIRNLDFPSLLVLLEQKIAQAGVPETGHRLNFFVD